MEIGPTLEQWGMSSGNNKLVRPEYMEKPLVPRVHFSLHLGNYVWLPYIPPIDSRWHWITSSDGTLDVSVDFTSCDM